MLTTATPETNSLPALVSRAADALMNAMSAAEVLEAREMATAAYDAAKRAARLGKAKQAHDELVAAAYRAQGDALAIESQAKLRLADEYDAAQDRGEVAKAGKPANVPGQNNKATTAEIGLSRKDIHDGRLIRDAEKASPGIVRRTIDEAVRDRREPTRTFIRRAAEEVARPGGAQPHKSDAEFFAAPDFCQALETIAGLPPVASVIEELRGSDYAALVDERLPLVIEWLNEFVSLWDAAA